MGVFENTVIVTKKESIGNQIGRAACIILIAFCLFVSFALLPGMLLVPAILIGVIWYLLKTNAQLEYEYSYIEGRLTVAKIKAKRKRKGIAQIEMEEVIVIAPLSAHELYNYQNDKSVTRKDCSSGMSDHRKYEIVYKKGPGICSLIFEPDSSMLDAISVRNSRKVVR